MDKSQCYEIVRIHCQSKDLLGRCGVDTVVAGNGSALDIEILCVGALLSRAVTKLPTGSGVADALARGVLVGKWLKYEALVSHHPKIVAAGPAGKQVIAACWELCKAHDRDDGEITPFWNEYTLGRWTLLDKWGEAGMAIVRLGMKRCLDVGLIECRARRGRGKKGVTSVTDLSPNKAKVSECISDLSFEFDSIKLTVSRRVTDLSQIMSPNKQYFCHDWADFQDIKKPDAKAAERKRAERARKYSARDGLERFESHGGVTGVTPPLEGDQKEIRSDQRRSEGEGEESAGVTPAAKKPPPPHLVFSRCLIDLLREAHPGSEFDEALVAKGARKAEARGVDFAKAAIVAEWAFKHAPTWRNGTEWGEVLRDPNRFWNNYEELLTQYEGRARASGSQRGKRSLPLEAKPSSPKLVATDAAALVAKSSGAKKTQ